MSICKYTYKKNSAVHKCNEGVWKDSDYCILHTDFLYDKNSADFDNLLKEKNKKVKEKIENGDFNFIGAKLNEINLNDTKIEEYVDFEGSEIDGNIHFEGAEIDGDINFDGSKIGGNVDFSHAKINKRVDFKGAEIKGYVDFEGSKGDSVIFFYGAKINDTVFFDDAITKYIIFSHAKIKNDVNFEGAEIGEVLGFEGVVIGQNAYFNNIKIGENVYFTGAKICRNVYFKDSKIGDSVIFHEVIICEGAIFDGSKIGGFANFHGAKLHDISFNTVKIGKSAFFDEVKIGRYAAFNNIQVGGILNFENSKCSDLVCHEHVCRTAKTIHDNIGDKVKADYYFYHEMVTKREQKKWYYAYPEKIIIQYGFGYGVHPKRVLLTWILIILVFAGVYLTQTWNYLDFSSYLYSSVVTAITPGFGNYQPEGNYQILASIEAIIGTFMWATLITTFARKYMR